MLNFSKKLIIAVFLATATQSASAALTAADELAQLLNNLKTMQASFEQLSVNSKGKQIGEKISGSMSLERPGKFRWKTAEPNNQLIIVNKDQSLLYDADLEQLVKRKMDHQKPGNPAMLLSSPTANLKNSFKIIKLKRSDSNQQFQLYPKTKENSYQWIKISFDKGRLQSMQIADNLGQTNTITFKNIIFNRSLPPKLFVFTPPKNTEIFNMD